MCTLNITDLCDLRSSTSQTDITKAMVCVILSYTRLRRNLIKLGYYSVGLFKATLLMGLFKQPYVFTVYECYVIFNW